MTETATTLELPVEGELPPLDGATAWINTEPLTPAALRGRPVLVEFGTFTCINWIRTLPYVRSWYEKYRDDGLVVLLAHTPEFDVERDVERVRRAMKAMRIEFPVAVDSDYGIWDAFGNRYWPALYFADADGRIRHHRFGEGEYDYSEIVLQQLLAAAGAEDTGRRLVSLDPAGVEAQPDWDDLESPETYVGYERATALASSERLSPDRPQDYSIPPRFPLNRWALGGSWTVRRQEAALNTAGGRIAHRFRARDLNLVLGPDAGEQPVRFRVLLDGEPPGTAHGVDTDERGEGTVDATRLYQLIRQPGSVEERLFEITFEGPGVSAYVFTFG